MNGLRGRMLRMPAKNSTNHEILLLYGHNASIERMDTFAEIFSEFANVTLPDLPGIGGMESFYKIGEKPSIDTYADYLAAFVKLRYKRKKCTIIGVSFSVPIYVRMLQKYPELQDKFDYCVSLSGFVHKEDLKFEKYEAWFIKFASKTLSRKGVSYLVSKIALNNFILKKIFGLNYINRKNKNQNKETVKRKAELDASIWSVNDFRTMMYTYNEMFNLDLCDLPIKTKFLNLTSEGDYYLHKNIVDQHLQIIFKNFINIESLKMLHFPKVGASIEDVNDYLPDQLLAILKNSKGVKK